MRILILMLTAMVTVVGCSSPPPQLAPLPDWAELNDQRVVGEVAAVDAERENLFKINSDSVFNLWVYESPGITRLTPSPGQWDIAFFDIGGRATAVYPSHSCPSQPCSPVTTHFAAASVMVAREGTFKKVQLKRFGQMRWGEPSKQIARRAQTFPLADTVVKIEPL